MNLKYVICIVGSRLENFILPVRFYIYDTYEEAKAFLDRGEDIVFEEGRSLTDLDTANYDYCIYPVNPVTREVYVTGNPSDILKKSSIQELESTIAASIDKRDSIQEAIDILQKELKEQEQEISKKYKELMVLLSEGVENTKNN